MVYSTVCTDPVPDEIWVSGVNMAAEDATAKCNRCVDQQKIMVTKHDEEIGFSHRVRHLQC